MSVLLLINKPTILMYRGYILQIHMYIAEKNCKCGTMCPVHSTNIPHSQPDSFPTGSPPRPAPTGPSRPAAACT